MKVFFASYARDDNADGGLGKAIARLKERVAAKLGLAKADEEKVVFFDTNAIVTGKDWEDALGDALRHSRVLVCMCSPRYFNREFCAKEFEVFRLRLQEAGEQMRGKVAIIPVIWEPGAPPMVLPKSVSAFQWQDSRFPRSYGVNGLGALRRLPSQREKYHLTIELLAETIGNAFADSSLPSYPGPVRFDDLPSWFQNPEPGPNNVKLAVFHPEGTQWRPVFGNRTVGAVIDGVIAGMKLTWEEIRPDPALPEWRANVSESHQTSVIVVPRGIMDTSPWKERLEMAVRAGFPASCALLFGLPLPAGAANGGPAPSDSDLQALLPTTDAAGPNVDWFVADDLRSLENALTRAISRARMALVASGPTAKVHNETLAEAARGVGISVGSRPLITGPAGGAT